MDNAEIAKKKEIYKHWWFWVLVVIVLIIIGNLVGSSNPSPNVTQNTSSAASTTATTNATEQSGPASTFGDGTFVVGTDIQPGTYRNSNGTGNCYYARLSGFGGTDSNIIANNNTDSSAIVTIAPTDKGFTSSGGGTWTKISSPASTQSKTQTMVAATPETQPVTPLPASTPAPTYTTPSGATVSSSGSVVTPPPAPPASWHTVATFSGSGDTNTNDFTIQGSKWRIDWSFTPTPSAASYCAQYSCNLSAVVYQDDGSVVDNFLEQGQQSSSGIVYEYSGTGSMYLHVIQGNVTWNLTVEDYY